VPNRKRRALRSVVYGFKQWGGLYENARAALPMRLESGLGGIYDVLEVKPAHPVPLPVVELVPRVVYSHHLAPCVVQRSSAVAPIRPALVLSSADEGSSRKWSHGV
jgi:hypothetical protein